MTLERRLDRLERRWPAPRKPSRRRALDVSGLSFAGQIELDDIVILLQQTPVLADGRHDIMALPPRQRARLDYLYEQIRFTEEDRR